VTNVVLIHTDDTGRYVGPYGHQVETPALERLADEGVLFRNAFCAGPTCSPARGALLTGQSPHSNGLVGLAHRGFAMENYDRHLAGYLSRNGYESVLAGQQHEADPAGLDTDVDDRQQNRYDAAREVLGYDRTLDGDVDAARDIPIDHERTRRDLANSAAAASYLRDRAGEETPFFLSVGLWNTHDPMPLDQNRVDPDRVSPPRQLPDVPAVREETAAFRVLVEYVDECVETVVEALRDSGQLEETLLLFTTDHGAPFPLMKGSLFDGGIEVALLARFPDDLRAEDGEGNAEDALVSHVDVFPTICDCLDIDVPSWVEGTSLLSLVRGETDRVREAVYSELSYHGTYEPKRCVRTDRYKYIRRFDGEDAGWTNVPGGRSASFLEERGVYDRERPREALYDCYLDPGERENLVDDPDHAGVYDDLSDRLEEWMRATDDPLLDGSVPAPDGARVERRE